MNLGSLGDKTDPSRTAFISLADGIEYRYGDVFSISNTVAADLADVYEKGEKVALLGINSGKYIMTLLGIMKAGMVAVPMNPKLPAARIREILADCGAKQVFVDDDLKSLLPTEVPAHAFYHSGSRFFKAVQPENNQPALILYTSGSTGMPKGVILSHQSHVWTAQARAKLNSLKEEITLIAAPLFHMQALTLAFLVLASGGTAVILPRFTTTRYLKAIEDWQCTFITAVPPMIEAILRDEKIKETNLSSVTSIRLGSAPIAPELFGKIAERMPQAKIRTGYGTTESGPVTFGSHPDGLPPPPFSAGYPHPEVSVRLNADNVLEIRSPALMNGYHNRPQLSPFTQDGYYITEDVFKKDEAGFYTFVGRKDDMFIVSGVNIFPSDVEYVIRGVDGITGEYQIRVSEKNYTARYVVEIEKAASNPETDEALAERVSTALKARIGVKPAQVTVLKDGELPRATHKAKRLIDERNLEYDI